MRRDIQKIVKHVHKIFKSRALTLSTAESCTGGLISSYLTDLPGASNFFLAGIVTYSEEAKRSLLGVSSDEIGKYGVISMETAQEMAEKMRLLSKADYAISTTGNLGPDLLEGKEEGLVYIAASMEGKIVSRKLKLKGSRTENKEETAISAMRLLIEFVDLNQKIFKH